MLALYDRRARKKPTNLSLNSDLLKKARQLDINLSAELEASIEGAVRRRMAEEWLRENREAIDAYNDYVEAHGVWSDGLRGF